MKLVLLIAAYILIPIVTKIWMERVLQSYKTQNGLVSYRPYVWIVGVVCAVFFVVLGCWSALSEQPVIWATIFFFAFALLGISLIVAYVRCRIGYDQTTFTVVGFWGRARTFSYKDITAVYTKSTGVVLYCGEQRVWVENIASGSKEFVDMANAQYKAYHGGLSIPKAVPKKDIFNGHIRDPWEFVIVYSLLFSLLLVMLILTTVFLLKTHDESNTLRMECSFTSCSSEEQQLVFLSREGDTYKMEYVPEDYPIGKLKALCDGQTPLVVYVRDVTPDDDEPYYGIEQIQVGDTVVLSFEENQEYYWQMSGRMVLIAVISIALLGWLVIAFAIKIGRNPSKYPRWVVRLFYKDGYVIYDE
ncbi:MAG: hypothetical protein E7553_05310 [Ruminococcaceae bacterium]|nr:hypothetical protein [Oscillospiraceae bacterium]